ncbi:hypothetical protein LUZ60_002607 [Juncus effusus]|nr:hypothetical protein LUZ60_002607 [Juncus effusus]
MASAPERRAPPRPPPPMIGRAGNLTIFITPPSNPNPSPSPVQAPPMRFEKDVVSKVSSESIYEFFLSAVSKLEDVHSRLDSYLADWFRLNDSKYQWALNDYYENNEKEEEASKSTESKDDMRK